MGPALFGSGLCSPSPGLLRPASHLTAADVHSQLPKCWRMSMKVFYKGFKQTSICTMGYSVQFSHSVVSDSLWPYGLQHVRPPCPSPTPGVYSNSCPLSQWCHPTVSSSVIPSPPALNLSQHQDLFQWVSSSHQVVKVLEFQLQHQSFQWIFRTDFF